MNSRTYELLKTAVLNRQQVTCQYGGHYREICPHAIGTKSGEAHVLSYQFGGSSSSGLPPGGEWRCMVVTRINNAQSSAGDWHTGNSHSQPQTCIDEMDAEVDY